MYFLAKTPTNTLHQIVREIQIHAGLSHHNVLPLYAAFQVRAHAAVQCSACPGLAPRSEASKACCFKLRVGFFQNPAAQQQAKPPTPAAAVLRAASSHSAPLPSHTRAAPRRRVLCPGRQTPGAGAGARGTW